MTTILPAADTFDAGSPVYDPSALPGLYIRATGWGTDPAWASGGTGQSVVWVGTGKLYAIQKRLTYDGSTEDRPAIRGAIGTTSTPTTGDPRPTGWLWRDGTNGSVDLRLTFSMWGQSNPIPGPRTFFVGLGARVHSGTFTSGGTAAAVYNAETGYWFGITSTATLGPKYVLGRVVGGVFARLAESPSGASAFIPWSTWLGDNSPRTLRLVVAQQTSPAGVVLIGYVDDVPVLTTVDTSGSQLANSGRYGFAIGGEAWQSSFVHAFVAHRFDARNGIGQVIAYDEFERADYRMAAVVTPGFPAQLPFGYSVVSAFAGDLHGSATYNTRIARSSDRLLFNSQSASKTGFYLSQRRATSATTQDRQARFEFSTGAAGVGGLVRGFGIALRGASGSTIGQLQSGYMAEATYDQDAAVARVYLWRFVGTVGTLIAQKTSGITIAPGTEYVLRARVETLAVPDPVAGFARVRVWIDGTKVELVTVGAAGIQVDPNGDVTDQSSSRITAGGAEGFYIRSLVGAQAHIYVDQWELGAGGTGDEVPEQDQASIPVADEAAGAVGTFPVPYDWGVQQDEARAVFDHELDSDHRFVAVRHSRDRRRWKVGAGAATPAEITALRDFFDTHKGVEIPFSFTPPGRHATAVTARFTTDALTVAQLFPTVYRWSAEVEEVLSGA